MIKRYSMPEMERIWTDTHRYEKWLEVELAVLEVYEDEGLVKKGTAEKIRSKVVINPERIVEIEKTVKHDVIAFLLHVEEQVKDVEGSRFIHYGMTSSDVLDTAFALQLREAGKIIFDDLYNLGDMLYQLVDEYRDVPQVGRTHGVHAEPITLGLKFASWLSEVIRNIYRIKSAISEISYGKISGAVGTYAHLSPEVERKALEKLGLKPEPVSTQVVPRDRHAQFFTALALVAGMVERIATEIRHLQRTEVMELTEPFGKGQRGSSAMPHKKNPILTENLCGLVRMVRSYALASLENVALWHERDISHSSVERIIGPDATILTDFMLRRLKYVLEGLEVKFPNLINNLNLTKGLIFSESLLLLLVKKGLPRGKAYEMVQRNALRCWEEKREFKDVLSQDQELMNYLSQDELENCFDVKEALRFAGEIIRRTQSEWHTIREEKR